MGEKGQGRTNRRGMGVAEVVGVAAGLAAGGGYGLLRVRFCVEMGRVRG